MTIEEKGLEADDQNNKLKNKVKEFHINVLHLGIKRQYYTMKLNCQEKRLRKMCEAVVKKCHQRQKEKNYASFKYKT